MHVHMYTGTYVNMHRLGIMSMHDADLDKDFKRAVYEEHANNTEVAQGPHRWQRVDRKASSPMSANGL